MLPIRLVIPPDQEDNRLEAVLQMIPVDYLCHRVLYITSEGDRALASILRDALGHMTVRRVLPGRLDVSAGLRDWLEVSVFLDMEVLSSEWMRDQQEEERHRRRDRIRLER
jgi:hypothetical protein